MEGPVPFFLETRRRRRAADRGEYRQAAGAPVRDIARKRTRAGDPTKRLRALTQKVCEFVRVWTSSRLTSDRALTPEFRIGQRGVTWAPLGAGFGVRFLLPLAFAFIGSGLAFIQ